MLRASSLPMRKLEYGPISMLRKEKSLASPLVNRTSPMKIRNPARPLPSHLASSPLEDAVSALTVMDIAPCQRVALGPAGYLRRPLRFQGLLGPLPAQATTTRDGRRPKGALQARTTRLAASMSCSVHANRADAHPLLAEGPAVAKPAPLHEERN